MKIEESYVRRLTISEVPGLDPIRVTLEDIGPGQGRINIECYGQAWANYWGGMGKDTIGEFVAGCDIHYIAGKLSSIPAQVFDPDKLIESLKRDIFKERRRRWISKDKARDLYCDIDNMDLPNSVDGLWHMADTLTELLGDEWWYRLPEKDNPDYTYLTRIITAVKSALKGGAA